MAIKSITPPEITKQILKFMKKINPGIDINNIDDVQFYSYVKIPDEAYSSEYQINECQNNVALKISKDGGNALAVWCIYQSPILLEAIYHHLWVSPDGEILDITPRSDKEKYSLVVIDPEQFYDGTLINTKKQILFDVPQVRKLIEVQERIFYFRKKYQKPYSNEVVVPESEYDSFLKLLKEEQQLLEQIDFLLTKRNGK